MVEKDGKTINEWFCDKCHKKIHGVDDGWVQWLGSGDYTNRHCKGLQLVHTKWASPLVERKSGCYFSKDYVYGHTQYDIEDLPLTCFVGHDGLMRLLTLIAEGELPAEELLEMIKRLHVPGYEQARPYFKDAIAAGAFEPNTEPGYHHQYQIEATLHYAGNQNRNS